MATLQIVKGADEGRQIPLEGDKFILGRNPDCAVVIPVTSVSREHAQILRVQDRFYIEDGDGRGNRSRNGTYVNNQAVTARTPLKHNDKIRICDFQAAFLDAEAAANDAEGEDNDNTTVEAVLSQSSHMILEQQPAERLRGLLEISSNLSKTLELDLLFPKIGDSLFPLFRQADRCFLILAEDDGKKLVTRLVKTRLAGEETTPASAGASSASAWKPPRRFSATTPRATTASSSARASSISASAPSCACRCAPPTARRSASSSSTRRTAARNSPRTI